MIKFSKIFRHIVLVATVTMGICSHQALAQSSGAVASEPVKASLSAVPEVAAASTPASLVKTDNPYGVGSLWAQSDLVTKTVLGILAVMSMGSWYVIFTKLIQQGRMYSQARSANGNFWDASTIHEGASALADDSPFRYIAEAGLDASKKHSGLHAKVEFAEWVELSIYRAAERVQRRLTNGMSFLATVGSTGPFVGLFGTVWGIYHALTAIGLAGQASIDKVAGPVGEALIMTAIGLAVAVPAVLGYNWLLRRNSGVMDQVRDFSGELHTVLLASEKAV
ncbi:MotA/TolQ/ExbB proton channel family protein [Burkholderia anthina]|uniref:MotA/TolQ/ExbB proton channel family protein n=1 Tax=Burkholderia anthina TaxID=179879 RepID=UPI00158E87A3|nr:MotA/TolQ/ExbB proton channel family protein [Burkholderia anthina]